jgi:hypothetical protein
MTVKFTDKIFFYCYPMGVPEEPYYQDLAIGLGEGFRKLGIPFYSDRNYWKLSPESEEYLFKHDSKVTPDDCSVVILNHQWFRGGWSIPDNLFHSNRRYITIYLEGTDDVNKTYSFDPEFRHFDFILKTHYSSKSKYPTNFYPWAFGLSERVLREISNILNFSERKRHILVNFRDRGSHSVRNILPKEFFPRIQSVLPVNKIFEASESPPQKPYDRLMWEQTGRRHYLTYYQRLQKSAACATFGGFFLSPWPRNPSSLTSRIFRKAIGKLGWQSKRVLQWDSWRFWESLAAGCVAFNLDFEKYGMVLPVMPENWRHYIGIDLDNIQETVDRIASNPDILVRISTEGQQWALEHYSPVPVAQRFLKMINSKRPKSVFSRSD